MKKKFNDISDEELDKMFRNAAEHYRPPNAPEGAWEEFLNGHLHPQENQPSEHELFPATKKEKRKPLFAIWSWPLKVAASLLIIAGSLWLFNAVKTPPTPTPLVQNKKTDVTSRDSSKSLIKPETGIVPGEPETVENNTIAHTPLSDKKIVLTGTQQIAEHIEQQEPTIFTNILPGNRVPTINTTPEKNNETKAADKKPGILITDPNPQTTYNPANKLFAQKKTGTNYDNKKGRWQLGILAGPNLSMVSGSVSDQTGFNAGIVVQKKLGNSRVSLESGVIYESMAYNVDNKNFNPGGNPVSSRVSNIEGTCSMIDVPVNIRYDVIETRRGKAFISTGVSPTVIVKQSYIYQFERDDGPVQVNRDVTGDGKNFYAVANFSVGYEQKWNRTSVQIAPYVKIPTGEIGYGNLNLGGIGTQISLKRDL